MRVFALSPSQGSLQKDQDDDMKKLFSISGVSAALAAAPAWAQDGLEVIGRPVAGAMGFQPAATEITLFVTALLAWVIIRYNRKRNPDAATFTHHTPIEIAWTTIPIVILVFIGAFSLPTLFHQQEIPEADITIKATGYQWFWGYEYVDEGFAFDAYMIGAPATGGDNSLTPETEAALVEAGYSREDFLLATDNAMVIPVGKTIVVQVTGADVIHAWTIPAFGVKQDAVPGRLAELWFEAEKEGIYFGQCSELCGIAHAYMPITVKVVSEEAYAAWLADAKAEFAGTPKPLTVASN